MCTADFVLGCAPPVHVVYSSDEFLLPTVTQGSNKIREAHLVATLG
jgi:hypothetical protein